MSVKKRYVFLALFLFCILAMSGFFLLRYFTVDERGASGSEVTFEWLIEPRLYAANIFRHGVAWIQEEEKGSWKMIDANGRVITNHFPARRIYSYSSDRENSLARFENFKGSDGYVDLSGDVAIAPQFRIGGYFRDGVAVVSDWVWSDSKNSRDGVIDRHGNIVLPIQYSALYILRHDLFTVQKGEKWGLINEKGETVLDCIYESSLGLALSSDIYRAKFNGKWGLVNDRGEWVLPAEYDGIYRGSEGLIGVIKDGKVGFMDVNGQMAIDFQFEPARPMLPSYTFSEGLAVVVPPATAGEKKYTFWVIDREGNKVFQFRGDPRSKYEQGFLIIERLNGRFGLLDRAGRWFPFPSDVEPLPFWSESGWFSEGVLCVMTKKKKPDDRTNVRYGYLKIRVK